VNPTNDVELSQIHEVTSLFSREGVEHWLFGGWAVDFRVGAVTRPHMDTEFLIWERDVTRAVELLLAAGYVESGRVEECVYLRKADQLLELYLMDRNEQGLPFCLGPWKDWPLAPGDLEGPPGRIGDVVCPTVTLRLLLETKVDYQKHVPDRPQREKDLRDIEHLRQLDVAEERG
jgi:aminoglycoside-2''-adenylyltransferase